MFQNNLFNQGNHMQLEMQVHQAFLNSPEGKQAEQIFAQAKKDWWDKVNNPQSSEQVQQAQADDRLTNLENTLQLIAKELQIDTNK